MVTWSEVESYFQPDGGLRDIYVQRTTVADWQTFLDFVRAGPYRFRFSRDGEICLLGANVAELLGPRDALPLLTFFVGNAWVNCHFFTSDEIELDIDPHEITREGFEPLVAFLETVGTILSKDVIVTPDNMPERWFLKFDHLARGFVSRPARH